MNGFETGWGRGVPYAENPASACFLKSWNIFTLVAVPQFGPANCHSPVNIRGTTLSPNLKVSIGRLLPSLGSFSTSLGAAVLRPFAISEGLKALQTSQ